MTYSLMFELEGLSFAARAVLATVTALTYELQEDEIRGLVVRNALGMSDEAFQATVEELFEAGHLYRSSPGTNFDCVTINSALYVLSQSMGPGGRPSPKEWAELRELAIEMHGDRCFYCRDEEAPLAVDHVHPVSRGGSNHRANLVPACRACNSSKGNKTWEEWYPVWAQNAP